jgi:hypothetical protein
LHSLNVTQSAKFSYACQPDFNLLPVTAEMMLASTDQYCQQSSKCITKIMNAPMNLIAIIVLTNLALQVHAGNLGTAQPAITLSSTVARATSVTMTVTLTPTTPIPIGGMVRITLFGSRLALSSQPNVTFVSPPGATGTATLDFQYDQYYNYDQYYKLGIQLVSGTFNANSTIMFTISNFTNPSVPTEALTNISAATTNSNGWQPEVLDQSWTGTFPAISFPANYLGTTQPAITLSNSKAGATSVTMSVTLTPATASPTGSKVVITLAGSGLALATSPAPVVTFSAPSGATGSASLNGLVLTVTLLSGDFIASAVIHSML